MRTDAIWKVFLYLTHWANLHTCTYNSRAVFFDFLHINIISHTHEFHTKVYFLHFFGRYLLAFTRKSCCFFTDLQVCVTIQLTFDQWIRLKTLSADFLSNFNISQGGEKAKLSQLNLRELREQHGCNKGKKKKKKHTTNLCIKAWISSRPCVPEAGLWSSLCVISVIDITCSSLVSSSSPRLSHFTSHELFDRLFSFFLLFWLST